MEQNNKFKQYQLFVRPPRNDLVKFLQRINENGNISTIIDLGCGGLYDTEYAIKQGYEVFAIDQNIEEEPKENLLNSLSADQKSRLHIEEQFLENLHLPKADFIYSFSTLPFCKENYFAQSIINIAKAINPNGYFMGNFFAKKNMLAGDGQVAREFSVEQISSLFDYLGFKSKITTYNSPCTADSKTPDENHNLTGIMVRAQAPEQLPDLDVNIINQILGFNLERKNEEKIVDEKPNSSNDVFEDYLKYKAEQNEEINQTGFNQPSSKIEDIPNE